MSLIQDALKRKTEEQHPLPEAPPPQRPAAPPEPPPAAEPAAVPPAKDPASKKWFVILAVAVVLILLAIGSSIHIVYLREPEAAVEVSEPPAEIEPVPAPAPVVAPVVAPAAPLVAAPVPKPAAPAPQEKKIDWPDLSFSGSAVGGNQILAIINGRMLSVGKRINGVEVLQIGKTEVLVEFQGEKRVLSVDDE